MPLGRHERRGSEIRAEHLARGKCHLPKRPCSSHMCPVAERGAGEVGNPEFAHTQISPLPTVLGDSHQSQGWVSKRRGARPCCTRTGDDTYTPPTSDFGRREESWRTSGAGEGAHFTWEPQTSLLPCGVSSTDVIV